jgi:hypothetical protein
MAEYQNSIPNNSNIPISTNTITRSGRTTKGPMGPPHLEAEKSRKEQEHKR